MEQVLETVRLSDHSQQEEDLIKRNNLILHLHRERILINNSLTTDNHKDVEMKQEIGSDD